MAAAQEWPGRGRDRLIAEATARRQAAQVRAQVGRQRVAPLVSAQDRLDVLRSREAPTASAVRAAAPRGARRSS